MSVLSQSLVAILTSALVLLPLTSKGQPQYNEITGMVVDSRTGRPVDGAWITAGTQARQTDRSGLFHVNDHAEYVDARAIGYSRIRAMACPNIRIALAPLRVRGLYLSFWGIGSKTLRAGVLNAIEAAHLNAIVIDIKGDHGFISIKDNSALAAHARANKIITIPDGTALIADLHKRHLHCIARIVVFKDDPVARSRPDLAVKTAQNALLWIAKAWPGQTHSATPCGITTRYRARSC